MPTPHSHFGLIAWLENTRIALPLKGMECRFEVTGAVACVEVDQIYHQDTNGALDCTYTFPLPAGAAVYRCELHVNGRIVRAKVEEKANARRIFREQKHAGRRAALVEVERENLFTLSLGNVQPGDVIIVRFAWFQTLDRVGGKLRMLVPTCPGVRYIPGRPLLRALSGRGSADDTDQVTDASRITPPRIDAMHPDAAYFSIEGRLSSDDVESGTTSSPSHAICVREKGSAVKVELSGRNAVPDRDFVIVWREPKVGQLAPRAWRWTVGDATYALVELRAPNKVKVADSFPQDFYFLVDRSGSMEGVKWERTCEALHAFVSLLGAEDRVWITLFESEYRDFAEAPMPAPEILADQGFQRICAMGANGGTNLRPAASHLIEQVSKHSANRRACVVLITDGQVGDDEEIVSLFQNAPALRVHAFGIDTTVNDAFLKTLARQQCGGCWLLTPDDDIVGTIAALGDRLRRPVITDLAVRSSWELGCKTLPDLHAGEVVTLTLRGNASTPLGISGRLPDGCKHRFAFEAISEGSEAIKLLWARERIATLLAAGSQDEAIELARRHNLICKGAAFIAWDEAEQVQIASEELVQPAHRPFLVESPTRLFSPTFFETPGAPITLADDSDSAFRRRVRRILLAQSCRDRITALTNSVLIAEIRDLYQRTGVAAPVIKKLLVWAGSRGTAAKDRLLELHKSGELFIEFRENEHSNVLGVWLENDIREALSGPSDSLFDRADVIRARMGEISDLEQRLIDAETPKELISWLIRWVVEAGTFDRGRMQQVVSFAESLDPLPNSTASLARRWQAFLNSNFEAASAAHSIFRPWLWELSARVGETITPLRATPRRTKGARSRRK